ncbi:MAG TPA: hypothetical protein VGO21_06045, partial [Candidatus Paceibacterota bacterium]|nr:hypothetical protein [Candidatus Paceibacterota bacterium]
HNIELKKSLELKIHKSVPLSQFMGGLLYWYLMRERGYSHAVLAHSINNSVPFSIGALLFKIYPPEKAEKIIKNMQ